jgi:hypothetical protein
MCFAKLPIFGPTISDQFPGNVLLYMVSEVGLQGGTNLVHPPFLKFYLFYRLFLHLADVSQFYSAIPLFLTCDQLVTLPVLSCALLL